MMKPWVKGLSILIGLVLVMALSGCGSHAKNVKTENVPPAPAVAGEEQGTPEAVGESGLEALKNNAQAESALNPIYFDFNTYNLKPEAETILNKTSAWLSKNPTVKIKIEGNCDERGTAEYNLALGDRRANSAKEYLIKIGVAANRLETVSWGKEKPLDPGHNEAAWAKNRRDDFNPTSQ
jgi:peptidoglycan-associated lipoprotein